jgi:hypothetical protein
MCLKGKTTNFVTDTKPVSQMAPINLYQNQKKLHIKEPPSVNTPVPLLAQIKVLVWCIAEEEQRGNRDSILSLSLPNCPHYCSLEDVTQLGRLIEKQGLWQISTYMPLTGLIGRS